MIITFPLVPASLRAALTTLLVVVVPGIAAAQQLPSWDPSGLEMTRAELRELLDRYERGASSPAYSSSVRQEARDAAQRIRERLQNGDFRVGDRIVLEVEGQESWPDTLQVTAGPAVDLPDVGRISLDGVLRSELDRHLEEELSRFIRDPRVRATAMIRLSVQGAVGRPGFYVVPADALLGDVLMTAGGPSQTARLDDLRVERGSQTLWEGDELQTAMVEGRTVDQLDLRAGDQIVVPAEREGRSWLWEVGRIAVVVASAALLGVRLF